MEYEIKFEFWQDEKEASKDIKHKDQPYEHVLNFADNALVGEFEFLQDCSEITTQSAGSIDSGIQYTTKFFNALQHWFL